MGLPVEALPEAAPAARAAAQETALAVDTSCGLPEPGLDAVVGTNLRRLRTERSLSLDTLARLTGLSRTLLGQIELGKAPSSVSVVWRIAQAFGVHFSALLATQERAANTVLRVADAKRLIGPDGRFSSRALYPFSEKPQAEFYELFLGPHSREDAQAHAPGTRENLIVTSGRLELTCGDEKWELAKGDAIVFTADKPHAYVNPTGQECWMYLVMTYAR
jgi:transcriptional regulator with XRE-family HTH domain